VRQAHQLIRDLPRTGCKHARAVNAVTHRIQVLGVRCDKIR
jgi:hypothetical protein